MPKSKKRPRSKLTEREEKYVDAVLTGVPPSRAALDLGDTSHHLAKVEAVKVQLEAARRWLTDITQIKRLDVVEGLLDSIEMGRMQGDPAAVRMGWVEIGKVLGHYAPEKKILELSVADQRLRSKFEAMTDEELFALQKGITIDGEAKRLN